MATHGSIPKFHAGKEDWSTWIPQLQYYFSANKITDVFKLIHNLLGDDLDMATFECIVKSREVSLPAKTFGNQTMIQV